MPNNLFKTYIQKIGQFLAKHPFALVSYLFLILTAYAAFLIYHYVFNPPIASEEAVSQNKIEEKYYEEVIQILDKRAADLIAPPKEYRDIFR